MNKLVEPICCCHDKTQADSVGNIDLNTKVLRLGKCKLSQEHIDEIAFILAHDLLEFAQNGGEMENLLAKSLYNFLSPTHKP